MEDEEVEDGPPLLIDQHQSAVCAARACAAMLQQYSIPELLQLMDAAPSLWKDPAAEEKAALTAALPLWGLKVPEGSNMRRNEAKPQRSRKGRKHGQ